MALPWAKRNVAHVLAQVRSWPCPRPTSDERLGSEEPEERPCPRPSSDERLGTEEQK